MVIQGEGAQFIESRTMAFPNTGSMFQAECIGIREALKWIKMRGDTSKMIVETDSLLSANAINGKKEYSL